MILLSNDSLSVTLLDPERDRDRMGPRFCTGGYIYQVEDHDLGPLLSGPEYPTERPSVINGQGLPEVFQYTCYTEEKEVPEKKLIIGVGLVENQQRHTATQLHFQSRVEQFCRWDIKKNAEFVAMETEQNYAGWELRLRRVVSLAGRVLTSKVILENTGTIELPFRWFAHPFFPIAGGLKCCKITPEPGLPENEAFLLDDDRYIAMNPRHAWPRGHYQLLGGSGTVFAASCKHPRLNSIEVRGDFPVMKIAVWANDRTFSVEPFCASTLTPGGTAQWSIAHTFNQGGNE